MRDAAIVATVRTSIGKKNGALSSVQPVVLSAHVRERLVERNGIDPGTVDDVVWGCVDQVGERTFDIAHTSVLPARWRESVPGTTVDRQHGSSQQPVHFPSAGLFAGQYDVVTGGVECMLHIPSGTAGDGADPAAAIPTAGFGDVVEMCSALAFLDSKVAWHVTGVVLPVDGGISI